MHTLEEHPGDPQLVHSETQQEGRLIRVDTLS
jgi:hypothetical protein